MKKYSFKQVETLSTPKSILDDAISSRKSINSWESADPKSKNLRSTSKKHTYKNNKKLPRRSIASLVNVHDERAQNNRSRNTGATTNMNRPFPHAHHQQPNYEDEYSASEILSTKKEQMKKRPLSNCEEKSMNSDSIYMPKECFAPKKRRTPKRIVSRHQKQLECEIESAYLCERYPKRNKSTILNHTKRKFKKSLPPITKLSNRDRSKKKIRVGSKKNNDVNTRLQSLKRKAEADTSQLHRYEKRRNHDFIKSKLCSLTLVGPNFWASARFFSLFSH